MAPDKEQQSQKFHLDHLRCDLSKTQRKRFRDVEWGKRHVDAFRDTGALLLLADKPLTQEVTMRLYKMAIFALILPLAGSEGVSVPLRGAIPYSRPWRLRAPLAELATSRGGKGDHKTWKTNKPRLITTLAKPQIS